MLRENPVTLTFHPSQIPYGLPDLSRAFMDRSRGETACAMTGFVIILALIILAVQTKSTNYKFNAIKRRKLSFANSATYSIRIDTMSDLHCNDK